MNFSYYPLPGDDRKKRNWKAYSTIVGGFIHMLYLGSTYIIGNINEYIAVYYNVTDEQASEIGLLTLFLISVICPLGGYIVQRDVNPKAIIAIGGFIGLSLMWLASLQTNFEAFKWLWAFSFGINNGLTFYSASH